MTEGGTGRRRLYLADLDSVRQAASIDGPVASWTPAEVPVSLRGIVRMAVLIGGTVVVTDTQLLDGRVFIALGPTGFGDLVAADHLDRRWPLEVCVRGATLGDSLRAMLAPSDDAAARLAPYEFSVTGDAVQRRRIARRLGECTIGDLDALIVSHGPVAGVVEMLRCCGLGDADAASLAERWTAWCQAVDRFACAPNVVPSSALAGTVPAAEVERVRDVLKESGAAAECDVALERIADPGQNISTRSRAYVEVLEPLRLAGDAHAAGAEVLRSWVDAWYHRATAQAINADVLEARITGVGDVARRWDERHWLTLDGSMVGEVGEMPPEVFAALRFRSRHDIPSWWNERKRDRRLAHRRLALLIEQEIERLSFARLIFSGFSKVVVLMAAVFVTAIDVHGWLKVVVFVAAALFAAGPEIHDLWRLRGRRLDRRFAVEAGHG